MFMFYREENYTEKGAQPTAAEEDGSGGGTGWLKLWL